MMSVASSATTFTSSNLSLACATPFSVNLWNAVGSSRLETSRFGNSNFGSPYGGASGLGFAFSLRVDVVGSVTTLLLQLRQNRNGLEPVAACRPDASSTSPRYSWPWPKF